MSRPFHLAIPAGDLDIATSFYQNILGCKLGNREEGKWVDVDFWGNELTLHKTHTKLPKERHDVDMGSVSIPHFGAHLDKEVFEKILSGADVSAATIMALPGMHIIVPVVVGYAVCKLAYKLYTMYECRLLQEGKPLDRFDLLGRKIDRLEKVIPENTLKEILKLDLKRKLHDLTDIINDMRCRLGVLDYEELERYAKNAKRACMAVKLLMETECCNKATSLEEIQYLAYNTMRAVRVLQVARHAQHRLDTSKKTIERLNDEVKQIYDGSTQFTGVAQLIGMVCCKLMNDESKDGTINPVYLSNVDTDLLTLNFQQTFRSCSLLQLGDSSQIHQLDDDAAAAEEAAGFARCEAGCKCKKSPCPYAGWKRCPECGPKKGECRARACIAARGPLLLGWNQAAGEA